MSKELVISSNRHETKVAVLEDDQVVEVYFQRENEYSLAGSIHKGRVTRVLPGMQSAFVDIGLERDAFLYVSDFFEDNEEYDKVVTSVEEKVLKLDRPGSQPVVAAPEPEPEPEPAVEEPVAEAAAPDSTRSPATRISLTSSLMTADAISAATVVSGTWVSPTNANRQAVVAGTSRTRRTQLKMRTASPWGPRPVG